MRRFPGLLGFLGLLGVGLAAPLAVRAEEAPLSDSEVWNEGVGYYENGDATNALRVLRPLMLSKTHGARAAEVVAALEHGRGNREEAAVAAQIALRAHPEDPRANRNYTRATDGLAEDREKARVEQIVKSTQGQDPGCLLAAATHDARQLMTEAGGYRTNRAERAVALADALSARTRKLADAWYPVQAAVASGVTNQQQAATLFAQIEKARSTTRSAAEALSDMDGEAYGGLAEVEGELTRFFKMTALPPTALAEDLAAQTNAWRGAEAFNGRDAQTEALEWTRMFRARFPAWARAYEQKAQSDTNLPPFTAEQQKKISELSTELEKLQLDCVESRDSAAQEKSLGLLREIQKLLPEEKNNRGGGQQNPQQNPQQQQQKQDSQQQDPQQNQQQQQQDPQQPEQKNEPQPEEQKEEQSPEPKEDQDLEAILQKAKERNDEHEKAKKMRLMNRRTSPDEKDW